MSIAREHIPEILELAQIATVKIIIVGILEETVSELPTEFDSTKLALENFIEVFELDANKRGRSLIG